jgi:hypothetical protein
MSFRTFYALQEGFGSHLAVTLLVIHGQIYGEKETTIHKFLLKSNFKTYRIFQTMFIFSYRLTNG